MSIENFLLILLASLPGTIVMTSAMYGYGYLTRQNTKVIHVFGSMLTNRHSNRGTDMKIRLIFGAMAHFSVGFIFALVYFLLWNWGVFKIRVFDTLILGVISGIVAIAVWAFYLNFHATPPKVSGKHYYFILFIAHILFAGATIYAFHLLQPEPEFYHDLLLNR